MKAGQSILGKELKTVSTRAWDSDYELFEQMLFYSYVLEAMREKLVDMYVFEPVENGIDIRCSGYKIKGHNELDEKSVLITIKGRIPPKFRKFWYKLDDQGEFFAGTFMYPEDY